MIYENRYNDKIEFIDNGDSVLMKGGKFIRYGFDIDPNEIIMVDPSGGPYIEVGQDIRGFFRDDKRRVVESIQILDLPEGTPAELDTPMDVLFKIEQ